MIQTIPFCTKYMYAVHIGPSIAVVTDRSETEMAKMLEPMGLKIAISTKVDNEGLKVEWIG